MEISNLPYEQELEICDLVIAHYTKRREELITAHVAKGNSEAREAYEMTADSLVGHFLETRGHSIPLDAKGRFDRGAMAEAILAECSDESERAYGYADLAREGSGPWVKFHTFQSAFYQWRDGDLDGVVR